MSFLEDAAPPPVEAHSSQNGAASEQSSVPTKDFFGEETCIDLAAYDDLAEEDDEDPCEMTRGEVKKIMQAMVKAQSISALAKKKAAAAVSQI